MHGHEDGIAENRMAKLRPVFIRTCTEELLLFNEKGQRDLLASTMFKGPSRHPLFRWFRVIIETTGNKLACGSNVEAHSLL